MFPVVLMILALGHSELTLTNENIHGYFCLYAPIRMTTRLFAYILKFEVIADHTDFEFVLLLGLSGTKTIQLSEVQLYLKNPLSNMVG